MGIVPNWIFTRGFNRQTLKEWECGITDNGSLVIPVRDENSRMVGWICRQPPGKEPRYINHVKSSRILFGQYKIQQSGTLCITEGALDTIWLWQNRKQSIAILGSNFSEEQEILINKINIEELILCLDNDTVGESIYKNLYDKLKNNFIVSRINLPKEYKDVQEIRSPKILQEIINNRSIFIGGINV